MLITFLFLIIGKKPKLHTDLFPRQCKPVINDSGLPNFSYLTNEKIDQIPIDNKNIVALIRKLTPNKANGSDGISGQMLLLCDDSVVLPLLFLIYINDLEKNIKSNVKHFAGETTLFSVLIIPAISVNELNHDLKVKSQWAYQWKMNFNPGLNFQATELLFSCQKNSPNHPSLFFNESVVPKVKEQTHLGLILDSNLSFERHVNEKTINTKKGIGIIKYLSKFLPIKILDQMYQALVRSHLDYCDTIYHIYSIIYYISSHIYPVKSTTP